MRVRRVVVLHTRAGSAHGPSQRPEPGVVVLHTRADIAPRSPRPGTPGEGLLEYRAHPRDPASARAGGRATD